MMEGSSLDAPQGVSELQFHNNVMTGISNNFDVDVSKFLTLRWVIHRQYRIVFD